MSKKPRFAAAVARVVLVVVLAGTLGGLNATAGTFSASAVRTIASPGSGHAQLYAWGVATMPDGSIIVGDYWNHRVVRFDLQGNMTPLFTLAPKPTSFSTPYGLAVDNSGGVNQGNIYIGFECCGVERFFKNTKGVWIRAAKRLVAAGMKYPSRVAVGKDGTVYAADLNANKIFVFDTAGDPIASWFGSGSGTDQLNQPRGIALDDSNPQRLFISDALNHRIAVVNTASGHFSSTFGSAVGSGRLGADIRGLAIDNSAGVLYAVDDTFSLVHKFTTSGTWLSDMAGPFVSDGRVCCAPEGLFSDGGREAAVDGVGNLWVGDMPNYRVQVFDTSGKFLRSIPDSRDCNKPTATASCPANGGFNGPRDVAVDSGGGIVATDTYNFRTQRFNAAGTWQWAQGTRGISSIHYALNYPMGTAISGDGSAFYVVDSYNNAIRKFAVASGDFLWSWRGRNEQLLGHPQGIAIAGNTIYIADTLNGRVVVLRDSGTNGVWVGTIGCKGTSAPCIFKQPSGVAVDPTSGTLYVSDWGNPNVFEYSIASDATYGTYLGTLVSNSQVVSPFDVIADSQYVYVSDTRSNQIKVFGKDGSLVSAIGSVGSQLGQLNAPMGLALGPNGHLYVAEQGNDRITEWCVGTC